MVGLTGFASLFEVSGSFARDERTTAFAPGEAARAAAGTDRATWVLLALIVALSAVVRLWGLGAVGLHGDEKTMSLPAMHIVEHGTPLLPSGMFYPRAVGQLYLMAASVTAFGPSEWALRLPSVLCGVLLVLLAWTSGRRFLTPAWNLALTAAVAFLPAFIEDAQTARMYVFLTTCIAGFMTLVFAWERTGRVAYLLGAVAVMLVGLQFHTLAVFGAFLVFFPGLLHGERRKFWTGAVAFAAICVGFVAVNAWIAAEYPQNVGADDGAVSNGPHAVFIPHVGKWWLALALVPAFLIALWILRRRTERAVPERGWAEMARVAAALLLAGGLVAELALAWHLAGLLIVAGLVLARRFGGAGNLSVAMLLGLSAAVAAGEAAYLYSHHAGTLRQIAGLMLGWPSVWPFASIAQFSVAAAMLAAAGIAIGLWRLAHREPMPDYVLLLALGVWIPLLMIGFMRWDIPPRYAEAQIMPMLIGAFATARWLFERWTARRTAAAARANRVSGAWPADLGGWPAEVAGAPGGRGARLGAVGVVCAAAVCAFVVDPPRAFSAIDGGYANHPDHKGAAQFVESLHPGTSDIIVAEDVLQQTYYLGHVNYWLVNKNVAAPFLHRVNGQWVDFYTNTPVIGTGQELEQLVDEPDRGAIYVIGSGENQEDGRKLMRSHGISDVLSSARFQVVYQGRDGLTKVWRVSPPQRAAAAVAADPAIAGTGKFAGAADGVRELAAGRIDDRGAAARRARASTSASDARD